MNNQEKRSLPEGAIELDHAINRIQAWNALSPDQQAVLVQNKIAFTVDDIDFSALCNSPDAVGMRIYFGLNTPPGQQWDVSLLLVGIDARGRDLINYSSLQPHYVFDFTRPCPSTCDCSSVLMEGLCSE